MGEDINDIYDSNEVTRDSELTDLLFRLNTEGRAQAIYQVILKSPEKPNIPLTYALNAMQYFGQRESACAARIAEYIGLDIAAAMNYKKAGELEKAMSFAKKVINNLEEKEKFEEAGIFAEQMELYPKATENYEKAGKWTKATEAAKKGGLKQQEELYRRLDSLTARLM